MSGPIVLHASRSAPGCGFIAGDNFGGNVSVAELRQMASPEWAAECTRIANELGEQARSALREATRDSERTLERCPPTCRSTVPRKTEGAP